MIRIQASNFDLKQIADSGQCFRMKMTGENKAFVIAGGRPLEICDAGDGCFELSCLDDEYHAFWRDYFDLDSDYEKDLHFLFPWKNLGEINASQL